MTNTCGCLSVVVPAYNEETRLGPSLETIIGYLETRRAGWELIVVDDGSSDRTVSVAKANGHSNLRLIELGVNQGKGAAVRRGVLESRGCLVLVSDADLSTPIEELESLLPRLKDGPLVIASRDMPDSDLVVPQSGLRRLSGRTFRLFVTLAGVRGVRDSQCGFKLVHGDLARQLFGISVTDGFAFDVELIWLVQRSGHAVVEVGVSWSDSTGSRVSMLTDPISMLLEMARFRLHHRRTDPLFVPGPRVACLERDQAKPKWVLALDGDQR